VRASTGEACRWAGRYADLPGHVHCFVGPLPPPPQPGRQQAPAVGPPPQRWTWVGPIDWFDWFALIELGLLGLYCIFQRM